MKRISGIALASLAALAVFSCAKSPGPAAVEKITVTPDEVSMKTGETMFLECLVTPPDATAGKIFWKSSSPRTVTVNDLGKISALGTEMEALDPEAFAGASGKAVLPVKAVTTGNATGYYYDIFKGDYTDTSVITDDIAISSVRFTGKTSPSYVYFINYDELNTFMGVAVDAGGDFGPVWREAVTLTPEGASPASEYPF